MGTRGIGLGIWTLVAAATIGATATTPAYAGTDRTRLDVTGTARLDYVTAADDVRLTVDAHAVLDPSTGSPFPERSWGTARISHWFASEQVQLWAEGTVECVTVGGRTATVSMIVEDTAPENADWRGKRIGFSLYAGGRGEPARAGSSGPVAADQLPECMAPAASMAARSGGFRVSERPTGS